MTRLFVFLALFSMLGIGQGVYRVRALKRREFQGVVDTDRALFTQDRENQGNESRDNCLFLKSATDQRGLYKHRSRRIHEQISDGRGNGRKSVLPMSTATCDGFSARPAFFGFPLFLRHNTHSRPARARRQGPGVLSTAEGSAKNIRLTTETIS